MVDTEACDVQIFFGKLLLGWVMGREGKCEVQGGAYPLFLFVSSKYFGCFNFCWCGAMNFQIVEASI